MNSTNGRAANRDTASGVSGRVFVVSVVVAVVLAWGALQVTFRLWRSAYRARAAYGASKMAGAIGPLAEVRPRDVASPGARAVGLAGAAALACVAEPRVDPAAWRGAVEETRAMLETLTASNALDVAAMDALAGRVSAMVARAIARPETARAELADLWDEVEAGAGPVVVLHHARPAILRARRPE